MIDIMLDIETLGRGPGCVVPQVAMVPFHLNGEPLQEGVLEEFTFDCKISIGLQIARGLVVDPETLAWWMKQDVKIRKEVFSGNSTVLEFILEFNAYIYNINQRFGSYRIWASAPKLDFGCLHYILVGPGKEYPILFSAERDLRTLRETAKMVDSGFKLPRGFNPHNAVEDCKRQVIEAQMSYAFLKKRGLIKNEEFTIGTSSDVHDDVRTDDTDGTNNTVKRDNRSEDQAVAGGAG